MALRYRIAARCPISRLGPVRLADLGGIVWYRPVKVIAFTDEWGVFRGRLNSASARSRGLGPPELVIVVPPTHANRKPARDTAWYTSRPRTYRVPRRMTGELHGLVIPFVWRMVLITYAPSGRRNTDTPFRGSGLMVVSTN